MDAHLAAALGKAHQYHSACREQAPKADCDRIDLGDGLEPRPDGREGPCRIECAPGDSDGPRAERIALGTIVDLDEIMREQRLQYLEAGTGRQRQFARDRVDSERILRLREEAQDRDRRADCPRLGPGFLSLLFCDDGEPVQINLQDA